MCALATVMSEFVPAFCLAFSNAWFARSQLLASMSASPAFTNCPAVYAPSVRSISAYISVPSFLSPISMSDFASCGFAFFASRDSGNFLERRSSASLDFSRSPSAV